MLPKTKIMANVVNTLTPPFRGSVFVDRDSRCEHRIQNVNIDFVVRFSCQVSNIELRYEFCGSTTCPAVRIEYAAQIHVI